MTTEIKNSQSGIVLFSKQSGLTSFASLFTIKRALHTKKVGHTGTLDSFADGLLVVLSGSLTRLVPHITAFDKKYDAVFLFGSETDTLDPLGKIIRKSQLPLLDDFISAVSKWTGCVEQTPPNFSAIHIDGLRASDIARTGGIVNIPSRKINVFDSKIIEIKIDDSYSLEKRVIAAHIQFHVSKGTYIRSLARDIASSCSSVAHVIALRRTTVGPFCLEDAVGYKNLPLFNLSDSLKTYNIIRNRLDKCIPSKDVYKDDSKNQYFDKNLENKLHEDIVCKMKYITPEIASVCGLSVLNILPKFEKHFFNGQKIENNFFKEIGQMGENNECAVFSSDIFIGVVKNNSGKFSYSFVINQRADSENS